MKVPQPPHVVELTPQGRGAVTTLLVEGRGARTIIAACVRAAGNRPLCECPPDWIVVGHFSAGDGAEGGEEVVVRARNEHCIELHCHGGRAAAAAIRKVLVERGCRDVSWRDWLAAGETDPIAAAARAALAEARTQRTAAILLDQYHGALRRAFDAIENVHCRTPAHDSVERLLARAALGRHLTRPWRVVLAGRPNVGKSSLMNALAGYRRAIVHASPGTTRDVVTVNTAIDGWPAELCDTAGLHAAECAVERAGVARAREALAAADLVLLVFDRSQPWSDADRELLDAVGARGPQPEDVGVWRGNVAVGPGSAGVPPALCTCRRDARAPRPDDAHAMAKGCVVIHNKCDLPPAAGPRPPGLLTSALGSAGLETLLQAISQRLVPDPPPPGAAVPFTEEHIDYLRRLASTSPRRPAD